jgi:NADPH:quinone reductase-like Zn-dependent oxidoreductase
VKAWQKRNGRLALVDVLEPAPRADELLLGVEAISLNRGEVRGAARAADGQTPGWDVAGTVIAPAQLGSSPAAGTRIAALLDAGGWAERVAVPVSRVAVIPEGVETAVAATLPIAGLTIVRTLALAEPLKSKRVLITGGSGGVGQFAIQLAAQGGAEVTAVSSRTDQHDALKRLGAKHVVTRIEDAEGPFGLVLESVGGASLAKAIELVGREGVVVTIGNSSEQNTTFNARTLYAKGAARLYGLIVFEEVASGRVGARELERLMQLVRQGSLHVPIAFRRDWSELPAALRELEHREFPGKAVLTLGGR